VWVDASRATFPAAFVFGAYSMFRSLADFSVQWSMETENTLRVLRTLTDASLAQRVTPEGRTLGKLAWHVVETLHEMLPAAGVTFEHGAFDPHLVPESATTIADTYAADAPRLGLAIAAQWTDSDLGGEVPMYGMSWARGFVLQVLLMHQAHHRGQITILMRQAGLAVPGVCGPSKEEWAAMGLPSQD
jgi:uncharacterized damage-inducible protein DinB